MDIFFLSLFLLSTMGTIAYCIREFFRTPAKFRYKISSSAYNKLKLQREIELGLAVEIKPQRRKALIKYMPIFIFSVIAFSPLIIINQIERPECSHFFGFNISYLSTLYVFYAIPIIFLALSLYITPVGLESVKTGFFPPLNTLSFSKIVARKGIVPKLRGYAIAALPVFPLLLMPFFHLSFLEVLKERSHSELVSAIEKECITNRSRRDPVSGKPATGRPELQRYAFQQNRRDRQCKKMK